VYDNDKNADHPAAPADPARRRFIRGMVVLFIVAAVLAYPIVLIRVGVPVTAVVAMETALLLLALATAKRVLVLIGIIEPPLDIPPAVKPAVPNPRPAESGVATPAQTDVASDTADVTPGGVRQ
jgi:hypothetical protein